MNIKSQLPFNVQRQSQLPYSTSTEQTVNASKAEQSPIAVMAGLTTPMDERQLTVMIDQLNMPLLSENQYQLQVAKSVNANGKRE